MFADPVKLAVTALIPSVNDSRWPLNWPVKFTVVPVKFPLNAPVTPSNRFAVTVELKFVVTPDIPLVNTKR